MLGLSQDNSGFKPAIIFISGTRKTPLSTFPSGYASPGRCRLEPLGSFYPGRCFLRAGPMCPGQEEKHFHPGNVKRCESPAEPGVYLNEINFEIYPIVDLRLKCCTKRKTFKAKITGRSCKILGQTRHRLRIYRIHLLSGGLLRRLRIIGSNDGSLFNIWKPYRNRV